MRRELSLDSALFTYTCLAVVSRFEDSFFRIINILEIRCHIIILINVTCGKKGTLVLIYSRTSRKRPPKISSLGGRPREVVAYESLDHTGSKSVW